MNSTTPPEDEVLARALRGQVDGMTEAPFTVGDIAGRAGRIQRRRRVAVVAGVAAAVAAIALPAAVLSGGLLQRSDAPQVATGGPSPTAAVEPSPTPVSGELPFTLTGLSTGAAPAVGWVADGTAHLTDGTEVDLPVFLRSSFLTAMALDDNLIVGGSDEQGNFSLAVVTPDGAVVGTDRATGMPVLSADGSVAAYVRPDGTPVLLTQGGEEARELSAPSIEAPVVVGVTGSAPCDTGCAVWVNDAGREPVAYRIEVAGGEQLGTTDHVRAVHGDRYLGQVDLQDDLFPVDGLFVGDQVRPAWTAETALTGFSPDGRWVVGQFSEGLGASELQILDADTGEPLVTWRRTTARGATALGSPVWEDDTHLLQVLTQGRDVEVVRFGLDGSMELTGVGEQVKDPTLTTVSLIGG